MKIALLSKCLGSVLHWVAPNRSAVEGGSARLQGPSLFLSHFRGHTSSSIPQAGVRTCRELPLVNHPFNKRMQVLWV